MGNKGFKYWYSYTSTTGVQHFKLQCCVKSFVMKCDNAAMDHKFVVCGTEPKYRLLQFCEYKMYIKDYFNVIQLLSPFSLQVIMN